MRVRHVLLLNLVTLAGGSAPAFADGCTPVTQAFEALRNAPAFHSKMEMTASERKLVVEQLVNGDAMFMKDPKTDTWHKMPISAKQRNKMTEQLAATHPVRDCKQIGTASVDGTPTAIYQFVQTTTMAKDGQLADQDLTKKMYIGTKDGRPYRIDSTLSGGRPVTLTVDYKDVQPPAQ